ARDDDFPAGDEDLSDGEDRLPRGDDRLWTESACSGQETILSEVERIFFAGSRPPPARRRWSFSPTRSSERRSRSSLTGVDRLRLEPSLFGSATMISRIGRMISGVATPVAAWSRSTQDGFGCSGGETAISEAERIFFAGE